MWMLREQEDLMTSPLRTEIPETKVTAINCALNN